MSHACDRMRDESERPRPLFNRFAILAALLCGAIGATAQVRDQITVEAVDVPVYVFSNGKPVRQLSKNDFELFVNGKPQPIDYFETVDFTAPPPAAPALPQSATAPPQTSQPGLRDRRLFLFLFDLIFRRPGAIGEMERSRRAAIDMVDHALPGDLFSVATITADHGITLAIPFLRDRDAIRRAILQLAPTRAHDALGLSITSDERQSAGAWGAFEEGEAGGGRLAREDPLPEILAQSETAARDRIADLANEQIHTLSGLAERLRDIEGFKHVILFSEGFPIDPERQFLGVKRMAASFQSSNVYVDTVDLTPIATAAADPQVRSAGSKAPPVRPGENVTLLTDPYIMVPGPRPGSIPPSENESLLWISRITGGSWIHWTNLLGPALNDLSASYSAVYRLGFKPAAARKGRNDIDVKVKNLPAGAQVSFRQGFDTTVPSKAAPDALRLADIIQNDTPQTGTPPELSIVGNRIDVIVPAIQLSKQFGAVDGAQVMLYVFDAKGIPVVSSEKTFAIPEHAEVDRVIQQKLELAPGNYLAKVLLRIGDSLAFVKEPFEISGTD